MAVGVVMDFEGATLDQYDQVIEKMGPNPPTITFFDVHNYLTAG